MDKLQQKERADEFFATYEKVPAKAIDYGFSTNKWVARKQEEVSGLKNKLKDLISLCGEYYRHELLSEKIAGAKCKNGYIYCSL